MSDDLAARLRAAIEERKTLAEAATQGEWFSRPTGGIYADGRDRPIADWATDEDSSHIVANQPSAVLRHCETDLRLLAAHLDYYGSEDDEGYPIPTLSILAQAYRITEGDD